jgi:hypothetical protein
MGGLTLLAWWQEASTPTDVLSPEYGHSGGEPIRLWALGRSGHRPAKLVSALILTRAPWARIRGQH